MKIKFNNITKCFGFHIINNRLIGDNAYMSAYFPILENIRFIIDRLTIRLLVDNIKNKLPL